MGTTFADVAVIPQFTVADRLRKAREHAGLEQQELADLMGVSRVTISKAERGVTAKPRKIVLNAWALATGVPLHWITTGIAPATPTPDPDRHPIDTFSRSMGANVTSALRMQRLSTDSLASGMGASRERVVALLEGRETWRAADIASAARVLGVSADWLLRLDSNQQPSD